MAKGHGKDSYFALEDVVGATLRPIGDYCDSIEFERDCDLADATTIGMEAKEYLPGLEGATINLAGKWDDTAVSGADVVLSGNIGAETSVTWQYGPRGTSPAGSATPERRSSRATKSARRLRASSSSRQL